MTAFYVTKLVWEYGEKYGHVFIPKNIHELMNKIHDLHNEGLDIDYPFQIGLYFSDPQFYVSFTVGHEYSLMMFAYAMTDGISMCKGPFYVINPAGHEDEIIPIFYFASYTEPDTRHMLPYITIREGVFHFAETYLFPQSIRFDDDMVNQQFIQP